MVGVLFGKSAAEVMKIAKEEGIIPGNQEDVVCLEFMLDIGDIREKVESDYRQNLIFEKYTKNIYGASDEDISEAKEVASKYISEQNRLMEYVSKGEQIRIWYSNTPYDMCGFYYICDLLKDISNEVFAVKLPEYIQIQNSVISYNGWGEIVPEKLNLFSGYEKKLSSIEKSMFSSYWSELVEDNSPLRAIVNGQLIGVPEEFYDHLILKYLGSKSMKEVQLIGNILGYNPIGIGDWWYTYRINYLIKNNKIKIVEDSNYEFQRIISCV